MPDARSALAPAKVNLSLEVLGRRDDGYHEIETVLQTLELADRVTVTLAAASPGVSCDGAFAAGTPADASNLAWRAAEELARRTGQSTADLGIHLEKCVPAAGGLGGGASDAATVLRMLREPWCASDESLFEAANAIGSDEAFFLVGGTALARGRGERVTALPDIAPAGVVLFVPPFTIERKTQRMFAVLSGLPFDRGGEWRQFEQPGAVADGLRITNSFERVAFDVFPALAALWEDLEARTAEAIRLAGAGPVLFWIGDLGRAAGVAAAANGAACTVIETRTVGSQWR